MPDDRPAAHDLLADMLSFRDGTPAYPKGDGRVEIPHGIVRLMGWREKCVVSVEHVDGRLIVSDSPARKPIGRISISMERARIPMSMLRAAGMAGEPVVIVPNLAGDCVGVWPSLTRRRAEFAAILGDSDPEICHRLACVLSGKGWRQDTIHPAAEPPPSGAPGLFVMSAVSPMVIRIVGKPFGFQAHWVPTSGGTGRIVLHTDGCAMCAVRAPERMFLVPVVKRGGKEASGFLLAQEGMRTRLSRQIRGRNPTEFDLVVYHAPFSEGMCSVHENPPECLSESQIEAAQAACRDPDSFVVDMFGTLPHGTAPAPARAPMFIVDRHLGIGAGSGNLSR
jgi:hypothetical protein